MFATTPHGPGFTRATRTGGKVAGTEQVVGCSAAGVLAGDLEVEGGPAVAALVLQGDIASRRFFVPLERGRPERVADCIADAVGDQAKPGAVLLLFADSYNVEGEPLLRELAGRLPGVRVVGGGASENGSVGEVSVFSGNESSSNAVAGILLAGDLRATVGVTHAVRRVGGLHRVTSCHGNVVMTLDGLPAYEAFAAVVPASLLEDPRRAAAVVLAGLSVGEGEFVVRHLRGLDPRQGAVALAAPVAEGQELFFGVRDPQGARDDLQRVLTAQAAAWETASPAAALYVNCVGRGRGFYGVSGLDTAYIRQYLGDLPVAGFFSGAEIAPGVGVSVVHQYTGVLAMLGPRT
ncbi:MAG TPA: FIST N-terminal domain-containing protein [Candidatus Nitrosopolaris sp.]|nr:FIST N-terminal domain-containing protein [Candidatus Nitrosopolaris sp.]